MPRYRYGTIGWKRREWSKLWAKNVPETALLRAKWNHDRRRYMTRFRLDEEDLLCVLQTEMRLFTVLQGKMLQRANFERLLQGGQNALDALLQQVVTGKSDKKYEFAAIDFEGQMEGKRDRTRITEFGITRLCTWQLSTKQDVSTSLQSYNFALKPKGQHRFVFGPSTRLSPELLHRTLLEQLQVSSPHETGQPEPQLILVGHNIRGDLQNLKALSIELDNIPQLAGIVDTSQLGKMVIGKDPGLSSLLASLEIPYLWHHLHCAGNDARYTMQAMLALLRIQAAKREGGAPSAEMQAALEMLSRMAKQPVREKKRVATDEDWQESLEGGLFVEEEGGEFREQDDDLEATAHCSIGR